MPALPLRGAAVRHGTHRAVGGAFHFEAAQCVLEEEGLLEAELQVLLGALKTLALACQQQPASETGRCGR